jgi:hypothetical protein
MCISTSFYHDWQGLLVLTIYGVRGTLVRLGEFACGTEFLGLTRVADEEVDSCFGFARHSVRLIIRRQGFARLSQE